MAYHGPVSIDSSFKSRKRSTGEILRRVWVYLLPYKGLALATVGCAVLSLACALTYPKLTEYIIDGIIENDGGTQRLKWAVLAMAGAFLLRDLFNSLRIRINNHFEQEIAPFTGRAQGVDLAGNVTAEGFFVEGRPEGRWSRWHENGLKREEFLITNGECCYARHWDENGSPN